MKSHKSTNSLPATLFFILVLINIIVQVQALPTISVSSRYLRRRAFSNKEDLNYLSRRGPTSSSCSELDLDDLQSLPGWPDLEKHARSLWGDGDFEIKINPPGYNDKPATMCVADPVHVTATGPANCTDQRVDIEPKKGSNTVTVDAGYTNVGVWNITKVTTAAHALFFNGNFRMPNITHPVQLNTIDTKSDFINAPFNNFVTVATNKTSASRELATLQDRTCVGTIDNLQCIVPAKGRIQLVATGYIWFQFKQKLAPLAHPNAPKHWRYALKIEDVLKNVTQRSAFIDFQGYMNTTMRSDYFDECRWNFKL